MTVENRMTEFSFIFQKTFVKNGGNLRILPVNIDWLYSMIFMFCDDKGYCFSLFSWHMKFVVTESESKVSESYVAQVVNHFIT